MAFNHYAKLKRIINKLEPDWYIRKINEPTSSKSFKGETRHFGHYYRIYDSSNTPVKFGKFQQIDRLASVLGVSPADLPLVETLI